MKVSPGSSFLETEKLLAGAAVAAFVNPYDLKESPNLQLLGTLFIPPTTSV